MVAAWIAAATGAQAQTRMEKAVIATGGGHTQSAASGLDYTMGQEVAGMAHSATTTGQFGFWSSAVTAPLSVDPSTGAGAVTALAVSPNPVSDQSQVNVELARSGQVQVTLYDVTGKASRVLFSGNRPAGRFSVPLDASGLASGTYFVAVSLPGSLLERPVTVVR